MNNGTGAASSSEAPSEVPRSSDGRTGSELPSSAQESGHPGTSSELRPGTPASTPESEPIRSGRVRATIGIVLFVAWGLMEIIWVWTNVRLVAHGNIPPLITAIIALALLLVLACFEGLEVSVIDRTDELWPGKPSSYLAGWLAARQLFVALIVTTATLLANRSILYVPFTSVTITGAVQTGAFDTLLTGLTVLWFGQILPKHLGAMNPDRYLAQLQRPLFPIVHRVYRMGISQPGEWAAAGLERRLSWSATPEELARNASRLTHPAIWRELIPHHRLARKPKHHQSGPRIGK